MNTNSSRREGSANDRLYAPEAATVLGMTVTTFEVGRATGYAPKPIMKAGARLVFRRGDLWAWLDEREAGRAKVACEIAGCTKRGRLAAGRLCPEHARRAAVRGTRDGLGPIPPRSRQLTDAQRFATYLEPAAGGCVIWCGSDSGNSGYGRAWIAGRLEQAHRAAFLLETGRMPEGDDELDHECCNRLCVRIGAGHVVEVTKQLNMDRMHARLRAQRLASQATLLPFVPSQRPATRQPCAA